MSWGLPTRKRTPIGLDIGSRSVKAVQLARAGAKWRLSAVATLPQPPDGKLDGERLREVLFRHGFSGSDLVLGAPTRQLEVDVLEVPPRSSGAPIAQIARMELARTARLESEPFELDCWELPAPSRGGTATSVMAVALRHQHADALLTPLEHQGFNVVALDTPCWALARACEVHDLPGTLTAVLDLGYSAGLVCLVHGGAVIYQRMLPEAALGILHRALREEFGFADEEADYVLGHVNLQDEEEKGDAEVAQARRIRELMARHIESTVTEIETAFQYAAHRYSQTPVGNLLLVGGGSAMPGVCEFLGKRLAVKVKILSPADIVLCPPKIASRCGDGVLTTALGLAWHGAK